jgi:uncharacterized membrane protein
MKKLFIFLLILSFLGFVDSTYLTIVHYKNIIPPCTITQGCETVLTSKFATIYGVPLAFFGCVYFFASMIVDVLVFLHNKSVWTRKIFMLFNISGLAAAFVFLYLQFVTIKAACQYCLLVELILFLLFGLSILFLKRSKPPLTQIS